MFAATNLSTSLELLQMARDIYISQK